jgi:hypothetical protein
VQAQRTQRKPSRPPGGLLDTQANPDRSACSGARACPKTWCRLFVEGPFVPIVYSTGFVDPSGYFLATQRQMRSKDVIFIANATPVDITKFAALQVSI